MINANHLMVFNSVANNLSFSRAAEELYTSQPSVSTQIKRLEEYLDIGLFEQLGDQRTGLVTLLPVHHSIVDDHDEAPFLTSCLARESRMTSVDPS